MSWAERLKHQFTSRVRTKGSSYARNHRVTIASDDFDRIEAVVRGSGRNIYQIELDWSDSDNTIRADCTCPYFAVGELCKHLWATIEWADVEGVAPDLAGNGKLYLMDTHEDDYYEADGTWLEEPVTTKTSQRRAINGRASSAAKANSATSWLAELSTLGAESTPTKLAELLNDRRRRISYVLDMTDSFDRGTLAILLYQQETRKDGSWGKVKPLEISRRDIDSLDACDADILSLAIGNHLGVGRGGYYGYGGYENDNPRFSRVDLSGAMSELLLPKLCDTGRFGWVMGPGQPPEEAQTIAWDAGPRWRPRIRVEPNDQQNEWTLTGELVRELQDGTTDAVSLRSPVLVLGSGAVLFEDRIALFDSDCDFRWVQLLRRHEAVQVPYADGASLLRLFWDAEKPIDVVWPANLSPTVVTGTPTGHLRVHPAPDQSKLPAWQRRSDSGLYADVHFKYGTQFVPPDAVGRGVVDAETNQLVQRNEEAEATLLQHLRDLKIAPRDVRYHEKHLPGRLQFVPHRLPAIVGQLLEQGWEVEAEGCKVRSAGAFSINITSGVDWFDLESNVDFGEAAASLPALLAAAKTGDGYVQLDDGSRGMLPQAWLDRFAPLADLAQVDGDRLRFKPSQAMLLDVMLAERQDEISIQVDRQFASLRNKLQSFAGIQAVKPPRGFRGELRPYQRQGLGWLKFLESFSLGGCLADDMGLGKTVQVLALLLGRRQRRLAADEVRLPSLVVAPKSVVFNWQLEAERFAPTLSVLNYTGTERKEHQDALADYNVIITTYGTLRRDIERLSNQPLDYVVLDEAQAIKNDKSLSAKACRLLNAKHRLTLTGTPIENHVGELWSQFEFLNPGMLGRSTSFRQLATAVGSQNDDAQDQAISTLRQGLAPFILRRTKAEVLTDLPEKNEQTLHCELYPKDRKQYDDLRAYYRDSLLKRIDQSGMNKSKMHVLEALLRLRQAACHPGLVDKKLVGRPSAKVDALVEQLTEVTAEGHKALVFSQFTSLLAIVRDRLDQQGIVYEYLDGRTRKRQPKVERFQTDEACSAFLISLKAGGTGLNLTAADYVFLLDPWWNPAVEAQAIDRAHRIGQTRRVFAYRLIARDTVEEKVLELQQQKRDLADAIIAGNGAVLSKLTVDDLQLLLG